MTIFSADSNDAIRIDCLTPEQLIGEDGALLPAERDWIKRTCRALEPGQCLWLPTESGPRPVLVISEPVSLWDAGRCAGELPGGVFRLDESLPQATRRQLALGWAMGAYRFERYRSSGDSPAQLVAPTGVDAAALEREVQAVNRVRDLVNTPAQDMGPEALAGVAQEIAESCSADFVETVGEALITENLPAIHAVGRASHRPPRLIDLRWGDASHPRVTLVGKGVCFDTGGLNLKPGGSMRDMKKDMGGAAHALALGEWIMRAGLPVRLRVLVPAVENAVGPDSYRPGDVVSTRAGLSVEIGNTDAEGRIVLSDALTLASEESPDLLIDFATLTGSARAALGADLPALFARRPETAQALQQIGDALQDPVWEMPLYAPYREQLKSSIADLCNIAGHGRGGNIIAALFLEHFIGTTADWVHLDLWAWSAEARPGRPLGGHAQSLRAVFSYLSQRYG